MKQRRGRIEPVLRSEADPAPAAAAAVPVPVPVPVAKPACKGCGKSSGKIQYGRYGYYFRCDACGEGTTIRFTCKPGHSPRLRKDKTHFYRVCEDCNSSELFHANNTGVATP